MLLSEQFYQTEKTGYLNEQFRLFHGIKSGSWWPPVTWFIG